MELSEELRGWIGRKRIVEEDIGIGQVRRIAGMLDLDPETFGRGDALPPHWFNLFFADATRHSTLGHDGHPAPGVILPPIPLPRRMGAGRRADMPGRLRVGDGATRTAEVLAIMPKQARTGFITVLTMRHTIARGREIIATEDFDAVYREAAKPGGTSATNTPVVAATEADWMEQRHLPPTLLFRYSAVTWNAHRIHYDADYARDEEGYPATMQNGGLTMQLLLDAAWRHTPGRMLGFSARLTRPIHVGDTITLRGARGADGRVACWVADGQGFQCGEAECRFGGAA